MIIPNGSLVKLTNKGTIIYPGLDGKIGYVIEELPGIVRNYSKVVFDTVSDVKIIENKYLIPIRNERITSSI
jgi:hypothetical protein